jgi:hypothetical protein
MPRRGDVGKYHSLLVKQRISSLRNQTFSRPRIGAADQRTCSTELMTSPMNRRGTERRTEEEQRRRPAAPYPVQFLLVGAPTPKSLSSFDPLAARGWPAFRQSGHRWSAGSSTFSLIHPLLRAEKTQRVCQSMIAGLLVKLEIRRVSRAERDAAFFAAPSTDASSAPTCARCSAAPALRKKCSV